MNDASITLARKALKVAEESLWKKANVVGMGIGHRQKGGHVTEEVCIVIFVRKKEAEGLIRAKDRIPRQIVLPGGEVVLTDVFQSGEWKPLADENRYRPVRLGCQIQRQFVGTLGGLACDMTDDTDVLLTAQHVVVDRGAANTSTVVDYDMGHVTGDRTVYQPKTSTDNKIGEVKRLSSGSVDSNSLPLLRVDAAICSITKSHAEATLDSDTPVIYGVSDPGGHLLSLVEKRGRTTGLTRNMRIRSIEGGVNMNYGPGRNIRLTDGFMVESTDGQPFVDKGDSGSLVILQYLLKDAVGVLVAQGETPTLAYCSNLRAVFDELNIGTLCECAVRRLIKRTEPPRGTGDAPRNRGEQEGSWKAKEQQLRELRDRVLPRYPVGTFVVELINQSTHELIGLLHRDKETLELAQKAFGRWLRLPDNKAILGAKFSGDDIGLMTELLKHLAKKCPRLKGQITLLRLVLPRAKNRTCAEVLSGIL